MIPQNRVTTHPGTILLKEYLEPMELTQKELADHLDIPIQRINEIERGKRGISSDNTAWLVIPKLPPREGPDILVLNRMPGLTASNETS